MRAAGELIELFLMLLDECGRNVRFLKRAHLISLLPLRYVRLVLSFDLFLFQLSKFDVGKEWVRYYVSYVSF
jgi:hypothetical protein